MCCFYFGTTYPLIPQATGYYGSFYDTQTQSAPNNTPTAMKYRSTALSNGVTIQNESEILFAHSGVYNIQFSAQIDRTEGSGDAVIDIWLRKNGFDMPYSDSKITLTANANKAKIVAAWNFVESILAGNIIELMWSTTDTRIKLVAFPEDLIIPHPAAPSIILTITQV